MSRAVSRKKSENEKLHFIRRVVKCARCDLCLGLNRSVAPGTRNSFLFLMLCLLRSRWPQTCVLSSSHRTTSNRTPKGNGSSTLDTERTTSSPSFTEPSWSDIHLSFSSCFPTSSPPPPHQVTPENCSSRSLFPGLASLFLPAADRNDPSL